MMRSSLHLIASTLLPALFCFHSIGAVFGADYDSSWQPANGTWYPGTPGDGFPDGGACGYGVLANTVMGYTGSTAGSPVFFQEGLGCGACYQVVCTGHAECSGVPIQVTITDLCPGGYWCSNGWHHFDFLKESYGHMGFPGQEQNLTSHEPSLIQYKRVPCQYNNATIKLQLDPSSLYPWYMDIIVRSVEGPGAIIAAELQTFNSSTWQPLTHNWGALWKLDRIPGPMPGPISIRLTGNVSGVNQTVICNGSIPSNWAPGAVYDCGAQFPQTTPLLPSTTTTLSPPPPPPSPLLFPPPSPSPPLPPPSPLLFPPPSPSPPPPPPSPLLFPPPSPSPPPPLLPPSSPPPPPPPPPPHKRRRKAPKKHRMAPPPPLSKK